MPRRVSIPVTPFKFDFTSLSRRGDAFKGFWPRHGIKRVFRLNGLG